MSNGFDEAYAGYLAALKKLDQTDEISEKNLLFRQLTQQLSDLEERLNSRSLRLPAGAQDDAMNWGLPLCRNAACTVPPKNS
jgi:hypothetical protein